LIISNFVSDLAIIGKNVKIWHGAYVGDRAVIGNDVSIGALAHVDFDVSIGDNSRIGGCAYIPPLTKIGKNVFIAPGVTMTNDRYPLSENDKLRGVTIKNNAVIGAGVIIGAGVTIGENAVVGMGSVVTKDVPPNVVVFGNPAKMRYTRVEYDVRRDEFEKVKTL